MISAVETYIICQVRLVENTHMFSFTSRQKLICGTNGGEERKTQRCGIDETPRIVD